MKSAMMLMGFTPSAPTIPLLTTVPSMAFEASKMSTAVRGTVIKLRCRCNVLCGRDSEDIIL